VMVRLVVVPVLPFVEVGRGLYTRCKGIALAFLRVNHHASMPPRIMWENAGISKRGSKREHSRARFGNAGGLMVRDCRAASTRTLRASGTAFGRIATRAGQCGCGPPRGSFNLLTLPLASRPKRTEDERACASQKTSGNAY
jgi:hypothetical protein